MPKPIAQKFPVESGLAIQRADLARWKSLLKPEVYEKLEPMVTRNNEFALCGYDVCRGDSITEKVLNMRLSDTNTIEAVIPSLKVKS